MMRLETLLLNRRAYWTWRRRFQQVHNDQVRLRLRVGKGYGGFALQLSIVGQLLRSSIRPLIPATIGILLILILEVLIQSPAVGSNIPWWLELAIEQIEPENKGSYDGLLVAIITVIGIFLTLYFTNLATVFGSFYAELPGRIRDLLLNERAGNVSLQFLVSLTVFSIYLLLAAAIFDFRTKLGITVVAVLGSITVPTFVLLSRRAFVFFDPTTFSGILIHRFAECAGQATISSGLWNDEYNQRVSRSQGEDVLESLQILTKIAHERDNLRNEAFAFFVSMARMIPRYARMKRKIPTTSHWFPRIPVHPNWNLADYTQLALAQNTHTSLEPEMQPNHMWVEHEIAKLLMITLDEYIHEYDPNTTFQLLDTLRDIFDSLGMEWNVEDGGDVLDQVTAILLNQDRLAKININEKAGEELARILQEVDYLGLFPITLLLGFIKSVKNQNLLEISERLLSHNWLRNQDIYTYEFPFPILQAMEFLQPRIQLEIEIEGRRVSPHWYIWQVICQQWALQGHKQLQHVMTNGVQYYVETSSRLYGSGQHLLAAGVIVRGLEFVDKCQYHVNALKSFATSLDEARVLLRMKWPEWKFEDLERLISDEATTLCILFANCIPGLAKLETDESIPDLFGQALSVAEEKYLEALISNSDKVASILFQHYFEGSIERFRRLLNMTPNQGQEAIIVRSSEPILNLLEISGYAFLLSEFHQNPALWLSCKQVWDSYINPEEKLPFQFMAEIVKYVRRYPALTPMSVQRSQWKQSVGRVVETLERTTLYKNTSFGLPHGLTIIEHPSLFVRAIVGEDFMDFSLAEVMDIFIESYLLVDPKLSTLDFGVIDSIKHRIDLQRQREDEVGYKFVVGSLNDKD